MNLKLADSDGSSSKGGNPEDGSEKDARPAVFDWSLAECTEHLKSFVASRSLPKYREGQLKKWIYEKTPTSFSEMSDLPRDLRADLEKTFRLHLLDVSLHEVSTDGTQKFLWSRHSGPGNIESVIIPDADRITYCLSSQAGCAVKCPFCATGHGGFQGQLSAGEIVDQVVTMTARLGKSPTNIVYMGMGEPLLNFDAVCRSLEILTHPDQLGMGSRRITVSTVGIPDRIRELSRRFPQVKIALSLHSARDDLRDVLVPMNRKFPLRNVIDALHEASRNTGRMVTMEYVILPGVNDSDEDIDALARLLRPIPVRINLIGFNPFPGAEYEKPSVRELVRFQKKLSAKFAGTVTLRRARGEDIQGACGQLSLRK